MTRSEQGYTLGTGLLDRRQFLCQCIKVGYVYRLTQRRASKLLNNPDILPETEDTVTFGLDNCLPRSTLLLLELTCHNSCPS